MMSYFIWLDQMIYEETATLIFTEEYQQAELSSIKNPKSLLFRKEIFQKIRVLFMVPRTLAYGNHLLLTRGTLCKYKIMTKTF